MADHIWRISCGTDGFHRCVYIFRINSQYHTDTHVEGVVHHLLVDIAFLCHQIKDRRYGVAVFLYNGYGVVFEHTRNVLVEAAYGDVAACFYGYTGHL